MEFKSLTTTTTTYTDIIWLCSTYVSTFLIEIGYVSTMLNLCSDCVRPMFWLYSTYVLTLLDLCFDFLGQNQVFFECDWSMFWRSRKKLGMFRLFCPKSVIFRLCARIEFTSRLRKEFQSQNWDCSTFKVETEVEHLDQGSTQATIRLFIITLFKLYPALPLVL